ncbi:hypothetical protein QBC40DRAFT_264123 [Triangularia verruculosa]|uniref:non-specific serine/threonine protein kinase n=1 Tax=Triangularia verruculosa TaxID=2587418 RepID=A0AAN6XJ42_9PEZI|nr:hypothetical protein QBC40DRAFT_264123 [Triangularia verruculosa]
MSKRSRATASPAPDPPRKIFKTTAHKSLLNLPSPDYQLIKPLGNDRFLIRRKSDGLPLLGHSWREYYQPSESPVHELVKRGAGAAAAAILNHENLVSLRGEVANFLPADLPDQRGNSEKYLVKQVLLLWDFCDGGSLESFLEQSESELGPLAMRAKGEFMPESFCWHVLTSLLRALQWLHEGVRETYGVVELDREQYGPGYVDHPGQRGRAGRVRVVNKPSLPVDEKEAGWKRDRKDEDWMPILHRDIRPSKIFLQHPRGTETYGQVKLGDFRYCAVSGTVVSGGEWKAEEVPVVAPERIQELGRYKEKDGGAELNALGSLRKRLVTWWKDAPATDKAERPYTAGNDLFAVGAILYHMMKGRKMVNPEECPVCECVHLFEGEEDDEAAKKTPGCSDGCPRPDTDVRRCFNNTNYTPGLKNAVGALLKMNREVSWTASEAMTAAWKGYETWTRTTEDGQVYRDIYEDILLRRQNEERIKGTVPEWTNNAAYQIRKAATSGL